MATADLLLELMFSWLDQRESCAERLVELAGELESLRKKCNAGESFGNTASVIGGASLIGAGVATVFTGGAAAPLLGALGAASTGLGLTATVVSKITEHFSSSSTLKEAEEVEEKSNKIAKRIQSSFEQLKEERRRAGSGADPDELDRHVMTEVLGAMARRSGLKGKINFRMFDDEPQLFGAGAPGNMGHNNSLFKPELKVAFYGILSFFTFKGSGKQSKFLFAKGAEQLIKTISSTGFKTVLKGGAMAVGGAVGLAFSLPDAIDNWKDLIKNNYVTEASQSLRDTAKAIKTITETLRKQLNDIKKTLESFAEAKRCIETSNRSSGENIELRKFITQELLTEEQVQWLKNESLLEIAFNLIDWFGSLLPVVDRDETDFLDNIHIIFVAHGDIREPMIPAMRLLPRHTIKDVLIYSPWNCSIDSSVAYGIATGNILPQHRTFHCTQRDHCPILDPQHVPWPLPNHINSMKGAGELDIPDIVVRTLNNPVDPEWNYYESLTNLHGQPSRDRIVIPFRLPFFVEVPFSVVNLALSAVLHFFRFEVTVHLAACLGKRSARTSLNEEYLHRQYAYAVDNTGMSCSVDRIRDPRLLRLFGPLFG